MYKLACWSLNWRHEREEERLACYHMSQDSLHVSNSYPLLEIIHSIQALAADGDPGNVSLNPITKYLPPPTQLSLQCTRQ